MPVDVDRLLLMIKQTDLPYQVFVDTTPGAREPEKRRFADPALAANEDVAPARPAPLQATIPIEAETAERSPTRLADVFRRMTTR